MAVHTAAFSAEALAENRDGRLAGEQVSKFQRMVSDRRKSTRGVALPVAAMGTLLLVLSGSSATAVKRHLAGWGFMAAAAALLAAPTFDPLAADIRDGHVEIVDGAIGKRRVQSGTRTAFTRYYLNIAGRRLLTSRSGSDAAPDAGYVRAYYLPRTRRLVNLERLPNPPIPSSPDEVREVFGRIARSLASRDPDASAEALAHAAGLIDAARDSIIERSDSSPRPAAGGLARSALLGRWTNPLVTLTLAEDGMATVTTIAGAKKVGHWSVDVQGRLLTDATGTMEPTDATLDDDRLTIQLEGGSMTFTRAARA